MRFQIIKFLLLFFSTIGYSQPLFNLSFTEVTNDGTSYVVNAYVTFTTDAKLASSNMVFTYDAANMSNPVFVTDSTDLTQVPFPVYGLSVTEPVTGRVSINVVLNISGFGDIITGTPFLLAQIKFDTDNSAGNSNLAWIYNGDGSTTGTVVFRDDGGNATTQLNAGTLSGMDSSLPVELISFTARPFEEQKVLLNWETASEENNDYFTIERSNDGIRFEDFEEVSGKGTTTELQRYQSIDERPLKGFNYYRLRQTDFDGTRSWSDIRVVQFEDSKSDKVQVYPNPSSALFYIKTSYENYSVALFNRLGQQVMLSENPQTLEVADLPSGNYVIKIMDSDSPVYEVLNVVIAK